MGHEEVMDRLGKTRNILKYLHLQLFSLTKHCDKQCVHVSITSWIPIGVQATSQFKHMVTDRYMYFVGVLNIIFFLLNRLLF
jgi:hypothetical protein